MTTIEGVFGKLIEKLPKLLGVIVTDKDGVVLVQAFNDDVKKDSSFAGLLSVATEQANRLLMGNNKTITAFYKNMQLIHANDTPLFITLIAASEANTGLLLGMLPRIQEQLNSIRQTVKDTSLSQSENAE